MKRTPLDRANNTAGHRYLWHGMCQCHICRDCGCAEHKNGMYWLIGYYSKIEPPCETAGYRFEEWLKSATDDSPELRGIKNG